MAIGPNTALALAFSGILGVYLELLRPGRVIAGCVGLALLLYGSYILYVYRPTAAGCLLLALAVLLFLGEALFSTRFIAGVAATITLFASLSSLLPFPHRIHSVFALSLSIVIGFVTTLICASAREARRNKWADLPQR